MCNCACHLPEIWEIPFSHFQHESFPTFFSAALKYQVHNLLRNKSSWINLRLISWIIRGSFLVIFLCWNPVQQDIICYLTFTSGSGFFLQEAIGNLRCCWYSLDKDQPLQTVLAPISSIFQLGKPDCMKTSIYPQSDAVCTWMLFSTKTAGISWCHRYQDDGDTEIAEPEWAHPPSKVIYTERYGMLGETEKLTYLMKTKFKKKILSFSLSSVRQDLNYFALAPWNSSFSLQSTKSLLCQQNLYRLERQKHSLYEKWKFLRGLWVLQHSLYFCFY